LRSTILRFASIDTIARANLGTRYSAAVVRLENAGKLVFERAYGTTTSDRDALPIFVDTRFDIASITKVYVATVALALVARGALTLDEPLVPLVPEWHATPHAPITLHMILAHTAGFKSGADYRTLLDQNVETFALTAPLVGVPGERVVYSDLGFIALGVIIARAARSSLRGTVESVVRELGAQRVGYVPTRAERTNIPATERDAWRGLVQGAVHDEKAALGNGVAGHAGLFANAADVARLAQWYLGPQRGRSGVLDPALAKLAIRERAYDQILRRGLGWALKTNDENSCGARMSSNTFGHTGFTGTCVWVDPERDATIVILTNAVHFGRTDIRPIRAAICDAAMLELDA